MNEEEALRKRIIELESQLKALVERSEPSAGSQDTVYRDLFAMLAIPLVILDVDTQQVIDANRSVAELYGEAAPKLPDDAIEQTLVHGHFMIPSCAQYRGDGTVFQAELSTAVSVLDGRKIIGVAVRKLTEQQKHLKQVEARFTSIFNGSLLGISLSRARDDCYLDVNDRFLSVFGYSREEVIGKTSFELNLWDDFEERKTLLTRLETGGVIHSYEFRGRRKSDETCTFLAAFELLEIDGERCVLAQFEDITERRRVEERFAKLFQAGLVSMAISTVKDGRYIEVNEAWVSLFGYSRAEAIGQTTQSLNILVNPDDRVYTAAELRLQITPHYRQLRNRAGQIITGLTKAQIIDIDGEPCIIGLVLDMTEQRRIEEEARQSELRFSMVFHNSPVGICISTFDEGVIVDANGAFLSLLGYTRNEAIGQTTQAIAMWDDYSQRAILGAQMAREGHFGPHDLRIRHRSGQILTVLVSAEFIEVNGQRCILAFYVDITERTRAEEKIRQSEKHFSTIFHSSPIPTSIISAETLRIIDVNDALVDLMEWSREELIGSTGIELNWFVDVDPTDRDLFIEQMNQTGGSFGPLDLHWRCKSGKIITAITSAKLIEVDGELCLLNFLIDITERRRIEEVAQQAQKHFLTIFNASPIAVVISLRGSGRIIDVNDAFLSLVGYSREQVIGNTTESLSLHEDFSAEDREQLVVQLREQGSFGPQDIKWHHRSGAIITTMSTATLVEVDGASCALTFHLNITERKRMEETMRRSEKRFSTVFHDSPVAITISRISDGRYVDANEAYETMFGYSHEELLDGMIQSSMMWNDVAQRAKYEALREQQGGVHHFEFTFRKKSGEIGTALLSSEEIEFDDERYSVAFALDITPRKRAENDLRISEERYRTISEMISDLVYAFRIPLVPGEGVEWMAGAYSQITGYPSDRGWSPAEWKHIAHPDDIPILARRYERLVANQSDTSDIRIFAKDGQIRWLRLYGRPEWDEAEQRVVRAYVATQDITERKLMEKAIQDSYQALEKRVEERTKDLAEAVLTLQVEIEERKRAEAAEREQRLLAEVLHNMAVLLNSALKLDIVLDHILGYINLVIPHDAACLILIESDVVQIAGMHGETDLLPPSLLQMEGLLQDQLPPLLRQLISSDQLQLFPSLQQYLPVTEHPSSFHTAVTTPIRLDNHPIGLIMLFSKSQAFFNSSRATRLQAFANQAAIAIQNAHLNAQARQTAVVEERNRISHELHDAVSQTLWSASLIADVLPTIWARNPEAGQQSLLELRQLTKGALAEMRTLLLELRPPALAEGELGELLRHLSAAFFGRTGIEVAFSVNERSALPPHVQIILYRIAQEALNNVNRHAAAKQVLLTLSYSDEHVTLSIVDNGQGFDPDQIPKGHLGLGIMQERALSIGATLSISSKIAHGTEITVVYPLHSGA